MRIVLNSLIIGLVSGAASIVSHDLGADGKSFLAGLVCGDVVMLLGVYLGTLDGEPKRSAK